MRVLVAILDWGLGHAARSVPIVRELQRQGCTVFLAGSGDSLSFLRKEFPKLSFFELPAYAPRYPSVGSMVWKMARQLPHFARTIASEHAAVDRIVASHSIDRIISDNRYGCWSARVPCAFITHQSNVLMPKRLGFLRPLVNRLTARFISRFTEYWIPDVGGDASLAGTLSDIETVPIKTEIRRIGMLSRFEYTGARAAQTIDVLAVISGPEPQRTILEDILMPQMENSELNYRVVRGLPGDSSPAKDDRVVNFATTTELQRWIESARVVVARSGYSTVMDMKALGKKVIFIPTPQQTEQEYLAHRLMTSGIAFCMPQHKFDLKKALQATETFSGFDPVPKNTLLVNAVADFIQGGE